MLKRSQLSRDDAISAIENGEFPETLLSAGDRVAVVMTQDWCPQWTAMESWISGMEKESESGDEDIFIFEFVYNRSDLFDRFLALKEDRWRNRLIPYVRYYMNGILVDESNYISANEFARRFSQRAG